MFKRILVPLDGSHLAEAAIPVASFLAAKTRAVVTLIHLIEHHAPSAVHGQAHLRKAEEAEVYLRGVTGRGFPEDIQVDHHVHAVGINNVAESLVAHVHELDQDSIVMCSHGSGRTFRLLLGSIAQKVIALGSVPVVIAQPGEGGEIPEFDCRSILVPLDTNPDHARALLPARELAEKCGADLHLTMVVPDVVSLFGEEALTGRLLPGTTSRILEMSVEDSGQYLRERVEALKDSGSPITATVLRGDPASAILAYAETTHIDLIVLATHARSVMESFWEGSVTHQICSRCKTPLLLVPARIP